MELMLEEKGKKSILGNIYVGQVENIAANIQAAFVMIDPDTRCYLPLSDVKNPVFFLRTNRRCSPSSRGYAACTGEP